MGGRQGRGVAVPSIQDTRQEMLTLGGRLTGPERPKALKRKRTRRRRTRTRGRGTHSRSEFRGQCWAAGLLPACLPACLPVRMILLSLLLRLPTTFSVAPLGINTQYDARRTHTHTHTGRAVKEGILVLLDNIESNLCQLPYMNISLV